MAGAGQEVASPSLVAALAVSAAITSRQGVVGDLSLSRALAVVFKCDHHVV
jgi:hypothetical protein